MIFIYAFGLFRERYSVASMYRQQGQGRAFPRCTLMPKQRWSLGSRLIRFGSAPEPRVAILLCVLWLLVLQAYEPWHLSRGYRPSQILSGLGFFLWRIGFNAS